MKPETIVSSDLPKTISESIGDFYAIIHEIQHVSDETSPLSSFVSADFGLAEIEPRIGRVVATYADAAILFNTQDIEMPIPHGARVHWPDELGVRRALGILDYDRATPAGYITMSGPDHNTFTIHVDLDTDYLSGPEGAHLNISGVSGLATKTSYAMFLLTAIQQKQEKAATNEGEDQAALVILNVKGADLLRLDEEDPDLDDATRNDWEKCGLVAKSLKNITYFYPYGDYGCQAQTKLDSESVKQKIEDGKTYRYYYDVGRTLEHLRLLVEDIDDPRDTFVSCADYCMDEVEINSSWSSLRSKIKEWAEDTPNKNIPVVSWRRFARLFGQRTKNAIFDKKGIKASEERQVLLTEMLGHMKPGHVVVIDIAQLPDYLQNLVVGDVIGLIRRAKTGVPPDDYIEEEDRALPALGTVILFADELNKFAPRQGQARSITRHLREVSERGRSEVIILFGAEQFRTGVDDRVTGNCSTLVFGRTTAAEANKDQEIKGLPGSLNRPGFPGGWFA